LCRYVLRPPLANDRLHILPDGAVRLEFKRAWSDGTTSVELEPLALIARLAALVPPPRRHVVRYFGILSSHAASRSEVLPAPATLPAAPAEQDKPKRRTRYIRWAELLRRVFGIEVVCSRCQNPLRLIALIKTEDTAKKILTAMHLPTEIPQLHPARPPPTSCRIGMESFTSKPIAATIESRIRCAMCAKAMVASLLKRATSSNRRESQLLRGRVSY
jgi:hypothetical protein